MKQIEQYISEKLKISKDSKLEYKYHPKDKEELKSLLIKLFRERGRKQYTLDFNDIDTSKITELDHLFHDIQEISKIKIKDIDVSKWDVSNVWDFNGLFAHCDKLNVDVSKWDVSKGELFDSMFYNCQEFNCDLSKWNVNNGKTFYAMFASCYKLDSDFEKWNLKKDANTWKMFVNCNSLSIPSWYNTK